MKKIYIITHRFVKQDGNFEIGGIETYIHMLIKILSKSYEIIVYQKSAKSFTADYLNFKVVGFFGKDSKKIFKEIEKVFKKGDIIIVSTEQIQLKIKNRNHIVLQHGVYWDLPSRIYASAIGAKMPILYKFFDNIRNLYRIKNYKNIVCVDYNYLNWFRSISDYSVKNKRFFIIPNSSAQQFFDLPLRPLNADKLTILFARRFVHLRGALLFCNALKHLITDNRIDKVLIVGEGELEGKMKKELGNFNKIIFSRSTHVNMPEIINSADMVVVPSLGSEGIPFIVVESLAAGKIVLASNVGGITNAIIDGFNGYLFNPDEKSLIETIQKLLSKPNAELNKIMENSRNIAKVGFHEDIWKEKWFKVLNEIEAS